MEPAHRCPRCNRENDPSFAFCHGCGAALSPRGERSCPRCGSPLPASFRFCGHCGQAVEAPPGRRTGAPPAPAVPVPPPAGSPPRLVLVRHDGQPGASHVVEREVTLCGRKDGDLLLPDDGSVSPRHAAITRRDGRLRIEDLGSASGTFLRLRSPRSLTFGDEIRLGRQLLRFEPMPRAATPSAPGTPWGSPDPGYRARLVQLLEGGGTGEVFPLRSGASAIGRESGEVAFPGDRYVSGRHARIDVGDPAVTLTDLGSSNGTFIRVTGPTEIGAGDQVLLGMQLLRVEA